MLREITAHSKNTMAPTNTVKYAIISPCRNEAQYMRQTLESVLNQTVPPAHWIIVDDGSTDTTPQILEDYASRNQSIHIVTRKNRGHRSVGPGVIDAFYTGISNVNIDDYDFICKLDLDLELPPRYFEILIARMLQNPRLGTCSGKPYFRQDRSNKLISEKCGDENSVGMTKFYRKECFLQIGGFVRQVMWDGIDGHRCRMLGWIACSWDEPELRFIHLRPMGSSYKGILTGRMRHGFGQYFMGTSFVYMAIASAYRMTRPPFIIGGFAMFWGYIWSKMQRKERIEDHEFMNFLHKYQWSCLLRGKRKATQDLEQIGAGLWNPHKPKIHFPKNFK